MRGPPLPPPGRSNAALQADALARLGADGLGACCLRSASWSLASSVRMWPLPADEVARCASATDRAAFCLYSASLDMGATLMLRPRHCRKPCGRYRVPSQIKDDLTCTNCFFRRGSDVPANVDNRTVGKRSKTRFSAVDWNEPRANKKHRVGTAVSRRPEHPSLHKEPLAGDCTRVAERLGDSKGKHGFIRPCSARLQ